MKKLKSLLRWIDDNILKLLVIGFIFAAPLYPKLPFIDIEYTYIYIRLEDFFVALMGVAYVIQLLRRKISLPPKKFMIAIGLFWAAVFASFLYGSYIQNTIPVTSIGFLHAARRVEYLFVFFVALASVRSHKDFLQYVKLIVAVFAIVSVYGIGQKFGGLPAVQTMNPEFARGHILYLTPEARISSTFAGHYDLAAYLVFLFPIVLSFFLQNGNLIFFFIAVAGIQALALTASRISVPAYFVSTMSYLALFRKWKVLALIFAISLGLSFLSDNLTSRFKKTFQVKQILVNEQTGQVVVPQKMTADELPSGSFYVPFNTTVGKLPIGANGIATSAGQPIATSDPIVRQRILDQIREDAKKKGTYLSPQQEEMLLATISANLKPLRTVVSDISFATRLQVEWPRAIVAFINNPIVGKGPSSITEATDNDYLRWLGEFGLFGTLTFLYVLYLIAVTIWKHARNAKTDEKLLYYGFLFGLFGLMLNATYIDVFEASKMAYQFWLTAGIFIGSIVHKREA